MSTLQALAAELAITVTNPEVWLSIGLALVLGASCLAFGTWVARTVGLLQVGAPAGETLGVGLASGLMVLAAWWAAIWSGGRSSFTPVAIGFAIALGLALARRVRRRPGVASEAVIGSSAAPHSKPFNRRSFLMTAVAGGLFIVAVALLNGSTVAPSPRDGVQPIAFQDEALYAVFGRDLALTGTEDTLSASGFSEVPNVPDQQWYHWGELWLASAVIAIFATASMAARYFVVLPIVLLAAAALTGTIVRRFAKTDSRRAYLFGFLTCLFLAPVPFIAGPFFSSWATGMIFSIGLYSLAAVAALLALYCVAVLLGERKPAWGLIAYVGSAVAFIVPAHIAAGVLILGGVASVCAFRIALSLLTTRRLPIVSTIWREALFASGVLLVATVGWALLTDHGMGPLAPPVVAAFNASWRDSVAITTLGGGYFFAIAIALPLVWKRAPTEANVYIGTLAILVAGAIAWGARMGDFTTFYLFFAGIAVVATPVAAIAVRTLWDHLRATRRERLALALVGLCAIQLELGAWNGVLRLHFFGPDTDHPVSVGLLAAIRQLPPDAKLAYACGPFDEAGLGVARLVGIDAHTSRRVVPICYEAEVLSVMVGAPIDVNVENLYFGSAPQRVLYPNPTAKPTSTEVATFLKGHDIDYIYADAMHPNTLVNDAVPIATSGSGTVLRIP